MTEKYLSFENITVREDFSSQTASLTSLQERFERLTLTPLGSRVMLPHFGSNIYKLIDKNIDNEWKLLMMKYLFDCFFDENKKLWDREFYPEKVKVDDIDLKNGSMSVEIKFRNGLEINFGYIV